MNSIFVTGRWYIHKPTKELYEFVSFDSDRPHPDVVMIIPVGFPKDNKQYVMNPDEFREPTILEDIDYHVLKDMYEHIEGGVK